jgi:hypothetical protein
MPGGSASGGPIGIVMIVYGCRRVGTAYLRGAAPIGEFWGRSPKVSDQPTSVGAQVETPAPTILRPVLRFTAVTLPLDCLTW